MELVFDGRDWGRRGKHGCKDTYSREVVAELVREARADADEDRFLTNRANMDMADRVISIVALVFGAVCVCALLAHVLFV